MSEHTIVGIASGMGGGIGVIRMSGEDALTIAGSVFRTKTFLSNQGNDLSKPKLWRNDYFQEKESHTIHYGFVVDQEENILDEVIVLLMKSPRSYTTEDVVEIDSHGGPFVVRKILDALVKQGAVLAEPGEFTKRAFLNGRIDLSQAEAVMKMISSQNDFALRSAVDELEGSVSSYIEEIRQNILSEMSYIEAALDDPEHISLEGYVDTLTDKLKNNIEELEELLRRFDNGRMKSEGINTVIVGKPNAGKSSLMNLMLDQERAIVTEIAGTTRDILEERVILGDVILNLVDTAGIRETEDQVEHIGVDRAVEYVNRADFIIYVVDSSVPLEDSDSQIIQLIQEKKGVILLNKSDLNQVVGRDDIYEKIDWEVISFSNETGDGLHQLEQYIIDSFLAGDITYNNQVYLTSLRHKEAVEDALVSLRQVMQSIRDGMSEDFFVIDLMDAYRKLGFINGETASEDLIQKIFQDFCMGK